jgi:ribosome-binding factor A
MSYRLQKLNNVIKQELGILLEEYVVELGGVVTITSVKTSPDLSYTRISLSCYKTALESDVIIKKLNANAGSLRKQITPRLHMRKIPKFEFVADETGNYMEKIERLFYRIKTEKGSQESDADNL